MINIEILKQPFHSKSQEDILREYQADSEKGLTPEEAALRLTELGRNAISQEKKESLWLIFLSQFNNALVYMLIVAAVLSFLFKEWLDGAAILVVILINAIIGFYMEYQAERSMEALKNLSILRSKVIRNGATTEINAEELVPGDLVLLEAGDMVPADGRIFRPSQLQVDEAALTGESLPVEKKEGQVEEGTTLAERTNMLYKGTFITKGNTRGILTSTGMLTEVGKIASLVQSAEQAATPLEKKLEQLSKTLIKVTVILVVIIFFAGLLNGKKFIEMLVTSIALAVAAIPEGLPIVATLALAQGMLKMARHNVIVKKLSAVETLGGTNVICTDKTGTLTQNKIEVNQIATPSGKYDVSNSKKTETSEKSFQQIVWASILCNTASLGNEGKETGDPLEVGLLKFAKQQGSNIEAFRTENPLVKEEPFSSDTKIMATLHRTGDGHRVYAKGASEELISRCNRIADPNGEQEFIAALKATWLSESEKLAASGLRVIAAGNKTSSADEKNLSVDLVFLGLIGMIDPAREEVFAAIQECKAAGIKVIMITGDHPSTAQNIANKLGIMDDKQPVMIGKDMGEYQHLTEEEKDRWISTPVFARVSPRQKLDLVRVLQDRKQIVGMTGDGVNDAPALKKADIGIAMGLRGTQVAQEVADMVLKDDSFSSIVLAIRQGRIIFENIRKFVIFLLSCNMSELLVIAVASVLNLHFQLFPLQILYINIITDILPALALGVTAGGPSIMKQKPRNMEEPIIDKKRWVAMIYYSVVITITTLGAVLLSHHLVHKAETWNPDLCNNILFFTLIITQLFHVFNMSSTGSGNFFKNEIFTNKYVWYATGVSYVLLFVSYQVPIIRKALDIFPMSAEDWLIAIGMSLVSLIIIQISKTLKIVSQ